MSADLHQDVERGDELAGCRAVLSGALATLLLVALVAGAFWVAGFWQFWAQEMTR